MVNHDLLNMNVTYSGPGNVVGVPPPVAAVQVHQVPALHHRHHHRHQIPVLVPLDRVPSLGLVLHQGLESRPRNEGRGNIYIEQGSVGRKVTALWWVMRMAEMGRTLT